MTVPRYVGLPKGGVTRQKDLLSRTYPHAILQVQGNFRAPWLRAKSLKFLFKSNILDQMVLSHFFWRSFAISFKYISKH